MLVDPAFESFTKDEFVRVTLWRMGKDEKSLRKFFQHYFVMQLNNVDNTSPVFVLEGQCGVLHKKFKKLKNLKTPINAQCFSVVEKIVKNEEDSSEPSSSQ